MIDEELYQFASDELNSDRRIKELWNRACALARDDHDEARFLYKNLRVEELLEQQATGEPLPLMPSPKNVAGASSGTALGLENEVSLDFDALSDELTGPKGGDEVASSTNRSFDAANSVSDVSEDLFLELEDNSGTSDSAVDAAVDSLARPNAADFNSNQGIGNQPNDEDKIGLDPLVFPIPPLEETDEEFKRRIQALQSDSAEPEGDRPSSTRGSQPILELGDTPNDFDMESVVAMNDAADSPPSLDSDSDIPKDTANTSTSEHLTNRLDEKLDENLDQLTDGLSNDVSGLQSESHTPLPSLDPEISSLAAQASQRMRKNNAGNAEPYDSSTADRPILDQTMDNTAALTAETAAFTETGSFESTAEKVSEEAVNKDDELAFLDSSIDENRENIIDQQREVLHQKDALTEDLERQADTWLPSDAVPEETSGAAHTGSAATAHLGAGAIDEILPSPPSMERAELLSGPGRIYRVFSRGPNDNRAVKKGLSWAAMFFTLPWLLVKRMPGTAIVYAALWLALVAGLIVSGLAWLDAPSTANQTLALWPLGFAALAVIGLILIPLVMANRWHAKSLARRGYEEIASVRARNPSGAVDRIVQLDV